MAKHRFSVLCKHAVIDKYSNLLSILDVLDEGEAVELQPPPEAPDGPPLHIRMAINAQLVSVWERSDPNEPETFWQKITITTPDGQIHKIGASVVGNMQKHRRTRLIADIRAIPFEGNGTYVFNIHHSKTQKAAGKKVAGVPFELKPANPTESAE